MASNVKEHAYLIKTENHKRNGSGEDCPLFNGMVSGVVTEISPHYSQIVLID